MADNSLMHGAVAQDADSTTTTPGESDSTIDDAILELSNVTKAFSEETAVDGISLDVERGELLTLLGPSGCGKDHDAPPAGRTRNADRRRDPAQ
jgi:ABC-type spermidine/putrescine transport systems, ATPase components